MNEGISCCFRRDQRLVSDGFGPRPDSEKAVEGGMAASTSVEAEADLVPVGSQMLVAQAVVDAEGPGLEVGDDAMHPGQDDSVRHRRPVVSRWKIARSICRADPPSMAAQDALAPVKAARSAQIPRPPIRLHTGSPTAHTSAVEFQSTSFVAIILVPQEWPNKFLNLRDLF